MFGHMKAQPILTIGTTSIDSAIPPLLTITEDAQPVRSIEFPASILLFVSVRGDPESGAFYVFDRRTKTWFWLDFDDQQYGGYSVSDFDLLIDEYDILSLVERPGLLKAASGWMLEPGKPAEMATLCRWNHLSAPFDGLSICRYLDVAGDVTRSRPKGGRQCSDD